jgi:SAM-dependent methyltransferase
MSNETAPDLSRYASGLRLADDGIWYASEQQSVSYPTEGNDKCFEIEDKSFWFKHRNACIVELVKKFPPRGNGPIVDVGGGNGFVARSLMDAGWDVVLVEPGPAGARNAKKRGLQHVICATTELAGFVPSRTPAIGVFDVVEHIEDDVGFLRYLHDLLEPGGMLYLTVPAYNFLWSQADISAGHYQRYTLHALDKKLRVAGFSVAFDTYIFRVLPLTVFLFRSLPFRLRLRSVSSKPENVSRTHGTNEGIMVRTMRKMLTPEAKSIARGKRMALGGSCLVAGRKPLQGV